MARAVRGATDRTGLSPQEAARRLATEGRNEVPARRRTSVLTGVVRQLRDPLVVVLLVACALTVATGDLADTLVIAVVVVVNTTVGVVQELRADRAVTALSELATPSARVRRGGVETSVPSAEVVPGDLVLLEEGDIVPADGALVTAVSLLLDESALTGEAVPVGHGPEDRLAAGTAVVKGRGEMVVVATGPDSATGRIARQVDVVPPPTPLERRLADLGRLLAALAVGLSAVVLLQGLVRGEPLEIMLVTAVSLAVAAVPESLPAVITLSLALGAARMAARNAIVRRLSAVETLGSVTVLATDKTGTLTQGRMAVRELWTPSGPVSLTDEPDEPPAFVSEGQAVRPSDVSDLMALLRAAALCNDASLERSTEEDSGPAGFGDPTEVALLLAASRAGLSRRDLEREWARVAEEPFDSRTAMMTTVHRHRGGERLLVVVKGSPEALHARHGSAHHASWRQVRREAERLGDLGLRVLAVAAGEVRVDDDWRAAPVELLGLLALEDPAKPAAVATVAACAAAGIHVVLITGDHPATARSMAGRVGILTGEADEASVVTGEQVRAGDVPDLTAPTVFARTDPDQKLDIVTAWKQHGQVVAMTGDGVNDGPALRRADIGVAMGRRGTEVARQASDLVLADDELATVVSAVEEGRRVYTNIRRFLLFGMSGGAAEIAVMLVGPFLGLPLPLLPAQILWINLLTHGLTGVALGAEPVERDAMTRPPRPPEQTVLGGGLWPRILVVGAVLAASCLGMAVWAQGEGRAWQTLLFLALVSLQLGVALGLRPYTWTTENPLLPLAILGSLGLALAGVYVSALNDLLGTEPLPAADCLLGVAMAVVGWAATRLVLGLRRRAAVGVTT